MGRRRKGLQYAVVYLPDGTLTPEAVGPFYSYAKACHASDTIDEAIEDDDIQTPTTVVVLHTLESALKKVRR